jgi:spermidine synthase
MRAGGRTPSIELVVFVVGAASLGTEIAAARLLAPWFGASTIVWANTIATVLVALSAGYAVGGRLADRRPDARGLCSVVLGAAALLAAVPFVAGPFLRTSVRALDALSAGAFVGSLLAVLALVAAPVLLLGAVAPYAIRLTVARVEESGRVSGRLYAISTLGSLVGTFLSALVLVPFVGTRRTFLAFALALALVALTALGRRFAPAPLACAGLLALPVGTVKAADGARVLAEAETPYQYARVVEEPDGTRRLELNEGLAVHSLRRPGSHLTGGYWDDFLVLPWTARSGDPRRVAILGNAAGTTARAFGRYFPRTAVDAVEIDAELTRLGRRFFDLRGPRLRTITADARPFLRATRRRYDAIFLDAYRQPYIPFYLATREFFALARSRLAEGGSMIVNIGHVAGSDRLERTLSSTMGAVFGGLVRHRHDETNSVVLATDASARTARLRAAAPRLHPDLRPLVRHVTGKLEPGLRGGETFADDRAPVEWMIDGSIVHYAAGGR